MRQRDSELLACSHFLTATDCVYDGVFPVAVRPRSLKRVCEAPEMRYRTDEHAAAAPETPLMSVQQDLVMFSDHLMPWRHRLTRSRAAARHMPESIQRRRRDVA